MKGAVVLFNLGGPDLIDAVGPFLTNFSDDFLEQYLRVEGRDILGSVGWYHLEAQGIQLLEKVNGDYFVILGLPMPPVLAALRRCGIALT